jgi:hypothetical protein
MITKVWVVVDESGTLVLNFFFFSPLAAELAIADQGMSSFWSSHEIMLAERG